MKHYTHSLRAAAVLALAFTLLALATTFTHAAVTNVAWYRLGENDPGAGSGQIVSGASVDLVAGHNLRRFGSARYTNNVSPAAASRLGSSLAVQFNGVNQFYSNAVVSTARDNFGIEAWVQPTAAVAGSHLIAHNGNSAANGWGLSMEVSTFPLTSVSLGGEFGGGTRIGGVGLRGLGRGVHVALVRDNGVSTFYVNGVASGSTNTATPLAPAGGFAIAATPQSPQAGFFPGIMDEVRVFTFSPGQFSPADLLVKQERAVTGEATDLSANTATLHGETGLMGFPTVAWFEWGTTTNLGNATPPQTLDSTLSATAFSQVITGVTTGLSYFNRAVVSNAFGVTTGNILTFDTHPSVDTLPASDVSFASATLNGTANPKGLNMSAWFEWGLTTDYGNVTPAQALGAGGNVTNFSEVLTNLFPSSTFHFRSVAFNGIEVLTGTDQTFVTPVDPFADRVIPGTVVVTIQPPEAVADGARWTLGDGPAMLSGFSRGLVPPGHHTVGFRNLANWREPLPVDVVVIGGKTSEVAVVFTRLSTFDFHDVPEQHARLGQTVEFFVTGTPSPSQLQLTAVPPTSGSLTFDPVTGHVIYTPSAADRLPFTLTFSMGGVPLATTTITPLESLPSEEIVINYDRPLPDDESRDYITISETLSAGAELFNNVSNRVLTVDISGKTLVFETNHSANLFRQYNQRDNIKEFRLFADRVIIRSPLVLPQTHVTIHARELRFEGDGLLDTTPKSEWTTPRAVVWADDDFIGFPGSPGHNGGDADVFVERFHADPAPAIRFVLRGGAGGSPGEGRDGIFEGRDQDPVFFPGMPDPNSVNSMAISNWVRLMARAGNPTNCGVANNALVLYSELLFNGVLSPSSVCGSQTIVARGEPAVPSGIPGAGGRGGTLRSTLDLIAYVSATGGAAGTNGGNYTGGTLVYPYVYRSTNIRTVKGQTFVDTSITQAPKVPGANATARTSANGAPGDIVVISDPSAWLHSFSLRGVVRFAKDAYLNGHDAEARALLAESLEILRVLQPVVGDVTNLTDVEFAETTSLDQLTLEMGSILTRIDMNLDFFGNPAGWVPMLSFEANLTAFQNEINQSIPILYLAYWLNYSATNLQNSAAACEVAAQKLREEFGGLVNAYNETQLSIPGLKQQAETINSRIAGMRIKLSLLETQLIARAQQNVEDRHKLPFWKKALGVLSVAADLVPVGQPTVGKIGAGLGLLAKIDPDHPVQSALAITNAFDAFNNKDITICYGSSTNGTNIANTPEQTAAAKKKKLKLNSECGKFLQGELKELAAVFKEVQVDSKELQAEIEKLKASDPVFQAATAELVTLNKDKERFALDLATAIQALATLTSDMTENTLTLGEMEDRVAQQLTALDHNALLHIKEMERRAKERLLKFQYFTAKAFQYRLLKPFNGNLQLNTLFDRFQAIVGGPNAHILTPDEFANLKNLFQEDLANTTDLAMTSLNANAPQHAQPRTFNLTAEELQTVNNANGQVTIDLKKHALFPSFHEDIRIVNLRVTGIATHAVGGSVGQDAVLFIDLNHLGESRLARGGQNFLFRHYQSESVSPIAWNAVLDVVRRTTNNSVLSPSSDSLLRALLRQPTDANMLLFSRPAANAEILIRREAQTDNGIDLVLDSLTIEVEYEFAQQSLNQRTLDVTVRDNLQPVIVVSQPDVAGRRDGQGTFTRVFPEKTVLTLQAPASYGGRSFDRWVMNNQPRPAGSNSITFTLTAGTTAEARYGDFPSTGVAPTIVQPPANTVATLGATATFTVVASGTAPLTFLWQKNGAPLTDGSRIAGSTNTTLIISNVALADAAAYSVVVSNPFGTRTSEPASLTVTAPSLALLPATPGAVGFDFPTATGVRYVIEQKFHLNDPVWIPVQTNNGTGAPLQFTRPTSAGSSFFRLRAE